MVKENIKALVTLTHENVSTQVTSKAIEWTDIDENTKKLEIMAVSDDGRETLVSMMFFKQK